MHPRVDCFDVMSVQGQRAVVHRLQVHVLFFVARLHSPQPATEGPDAFDHATGGLCTTPAGSFSSTDRLMFVVSLMVRSVSQRQGPTAFSPVVNVAPCFSLSSLSLIVFNFFAFEHFYNLLTPLTNMMEEDCLEKARTCMEVPCHVANGSIPQNKKVGDAEKATGSTAKMVPTLMWSSPRRMPTHQKTKPNQLTVTRKNSLKCLSSNNLAKSS